jgi:hypothetical protein
MMGRVLSRSLLDGTVASTPIKARLADEHLAHLRAQASIALAEAVDGSACGFEFLLFRHGISP